MAVARIEQEPIEYADPLKQIDIRSQEGPGLIFARVPLYLIKPSDAALDDENVARLMKSFREQREAQVGVTGQMEPIFLGHLEGLPRFEIINGLHRYSTGWSLNVEYMLATIRLNSTREQINDLRIPAANPHGRVKFARVIRWAEEIWEDSEWGHEPDGLLRASTLAAERGATGAEWGYSLEETEARRAWMLDKCKKWELKPVTILRYLRSANGADTEVIRNVREAKKNGNEPVFTQRHLVVTTASLAGRPEHQRVVQSTVLEEGLSVDRTEELARAVRSAQTVDEARQVAETFLTQQIILKKDSEPIQDYWQVVGEMTSLFLGMESRLPAIANVLANGDLKDLHLRTTGGVADELRKRMAEEVRVPIPDDLFDADQRRLFALNTDVFGSQVTKRTADHIVRTLLAGFFGLPPRFEVLNSKDQEYDWALAKHPTSPVVARVFGLRDMDQTFTAQGFDLLYDPLIRSTKPQGSEVDVLPEIGAGTKITRVADKITCQFMRFERTKAGVGVVVKIGNKKVVHFPLSQLGTEYTI